MSICFYFYIYGVHPTSAAGGSGLRPNHLLELIRVPDTRYSTSLLAALTALVNMLAAGRAPTSVSKWVCGAPLTALTKPTGGVRPIAVGETLRRLFSSCLMSSVKQGARTYLQPFQLGIATPRGVEGMIHAARRAVAAHGSTGQYAMLSVDLQNAFSLVSRPAVLHETLARFPQLYRWVYYCYGHTPPTLWFRSSHMKSVLGVQQGDPLGPLLFALALQPVLSKIADTTTPDLGHDVQPLLLWYRDDGVIIGKHSYLQNALRTLRSTDTLGRGLHLSLEKSSIWWPTAPSARDAAGYPADLPIPKERPSYEHLLVPILSASPLSSPMSRP